MTHGTSGGPPPATERELVSAAQQDERAFRALVEPSRPLVHAHCYRMLGSAHEADDALQETWVRAWRSLGQFEGRSAFGSWLYRIATNVCLDQLANRSRRELPVHAFPAADPTVRPTSVPLVDSTWVEPYADVQVGVGDGRASPEARYELRESVELAFVAAMQHLPPRQRAALLLRDVLGFSAKEAAEALDVSTASINSALQHARASARRLLPDRSQQQTLRALGAARVDELVAAYLDAWDRNDVDGVVALLTEEARFSMPPVPYWFQGREVLRGWLPKGPLSGWRWRHRSVQANGAPAVAFYCWHEGEGAYLAFALNLLSFEGPRIADVTAFIARATDSPDPATYERWADEPLLRRKFEAFFGRFGLPDRL